MPEIRKKYKEKYNLDLADELRAKPHPTLKCLLELVNKGGPNSKKVSAVWLVNANLLTEQALKTYLSHICLFQMASIFVLNIKAYFMYIRQSKHWYSY